MKIKAVTNNLALITTSITAGQFYKVQQSEPDLLKVKDEQGNDLFAIGLTHTNGSWNNAGAEFHASGEELTIALEIPTETKEDLKIAVTKLIYKTAKYLKQIEEQVAANVLRIEREELDFINSIED